WSDALSSMGLHQEADAGWRRELLICERMVADYPTGDHRRYLVPELVGLGSHLGSQGRVLEREKALRLALKLCEKLVADSPENPGHINKLGIIFINLVITCSDQGRLEEAER